MQSSVPADHLAPEPGADAAAAPSNDDDLRRGILRTRVSRPVAWALAASFLLSIYAVPLGQFFLEYRAEEESPLLDLARQPPTAENLKQVEHDLEVTSYAKSLVQPHLQLLLTRYGRVGNKRAIVGHGGFLYYTPGVLHVGGPGFLEPEIQRERELAAREAGEEPLQADPLPAIVDFHAALAQRGIRLIVMPVPDKAAAEAPSLHARGRGEHPPKNPDFDRFKAELDSRGVAVFDAREQLPPGHRGPVFLTQDTHWTPAWMERVARALGAYVHELGVLSPAPQSTLRAVEQSVARVGDVVDMLHLPEDQQLFAPQTVEIHQVQDARGEPWEPDPGAEILLLGDSFSNVFSLEGMGWGAAAGLAPQLALALQRPVDVIARNDAGAFATRRMLARELGAGQDRLAGKRIVIWEFAERELSAGDWKRFDLPSPAAAEAP